MVENRFVEEAVVEKKFVVVAEVPVAFTKVKFWRVEDPSAKRFVLVTVPVAVKLASDTFPLNNPFPCTENTCDGDEVPIPTFPLFATLK